jgi:hypothetical protein
MGVRKASVKLGRGGKLVDDAGMSRMGRIAAAIGIVAFAVLLVGGLWQVVQLMQLRTHEEAQARIANTPLQRCLGENLAADIAARAWRAIQLACEAVVREDASPAAKCVLANREAVLQDETTDTALASCGFRLETEETLR